MADKVLDATGLSCPLPVLKVRKTLKAMSPGQTLELLATDPGTLEDVPEFCGTSGHSLLENSVLDSNIYRFVIRCSD